MAVSTAPSTKKKCPDCGKMTEHRTVKQGRDRHGVQRFQTRCVPCHNDSNRVATALRMEANRKRDPNYGRGIHNNPTPSRRKKGQQ